MARKNVNPRDKDRRSVTVILGSIDEYNSFDQLIQMIGMIQNRLDNDPQLKDCRVSMDFEKEHGYYNDVTVKVVFYTHRPETDEEMDMRIDADNKRMYRDAKITADNLSRQIKSLSPEDKKKLIDLLGENNER